MKCLSVGIILGLTFTVTAVAGDILAPEIPLVDLGAREYAWGHIGGLYDQGSNSLPQDHRLAGQKRAQLIQPLDAGGQPSPTGQIGFLAIGTPATSRAFCGTQSAACEPGSFTAILERTGRRNPALRLVDGSMELMPRTSSDWSWPDDPRYDLIRDTRLSAAGVTEAQVQVGWVEIEEEVAGRSLPYQDSNAYRLKKHLANVLRAMKVRYPNLQIVYLSSALYGGYAVDDWAQEPYAFESGFAPRWVILEQAAQERNGFQTDTRVGLIEYSRGRAPWLAWGPYLWAKGDSSRSDGMQWERGDFEADGRALTEEGAHKVGSLLLNFLAGESTATSWLWAEGLGKRRGVRP